MVWPLVEAQHAQAGPPHSEPAPSHPTKLVVDRFLLGVRTGDMGVISSVMADQFVAMTRQGTMTTLGHLSAYIEQTLQLISPVDNLWRMEAEHYHDDWAFCVMSFGQTLPLVTLTFQVVDERVRFVSLASHAQGILAVKQGLGRYRGGA